MNDLTKEKTMSSALDELFAKIKEKIKKTSETEEDRGLTSYNQLEASITADDTQYKQLEKSFPISNSVLKQNLPTLFKIIDTISVKNIIYAEETLVNKLLNDILFSELKKIDNNVQEFYKTITLANQPDKCKTQQVEKPVYQKLEVVYHIKDQKYILTFPDFLDDAFETIVKKINNNPLLKDMVSIEWGTKSAIAEEAPEEEATVVTTTLATIVAATLAA